MARTKPSTGMTTRRSAQHHTRAFAASVTPTPGSQPARAKQSSTTSGASKPAPKKRPSTQKASQPRRTTTWKKVRVWWPPTKDKRKTDFGGAYWPAKVTEQSEGGFHVEYDNGDTEVVDAENVSPASVPVDFGEESVRLQVGEYCEVFNDSKTDPAAWLARVQKVGRGRYTIEFPFHDSQDEVIEEERIRRARVYDEETRAWKLISPAQEWEEGEVTSPLELELLTHMSELNEAIKKKKPAAQKPKPKPKAARKSATPWPAPKRAAAEKSDKDQIEKKRKVEKSTALALAPSPPPISPPPQVPVAGLEGIVTNSQGQVQIPPGLQLQPNLLLMHQLGMMMPNLPDAGAPPGLAPKPKRKKDMNAPKKGKTAYVVFMEKHRPLIKQNEPDVLPQNIMSRIGELWSNVSPEEREECEKAAEQDRERYNKEMESYVPPPEDELTEKPTKRRRRVDTGHPKKPLSAYLLFSKEFRASLKSVPFSEATKTTAKAWKELKPEELKKWDEIAAIEKSKYDKEKEEFDAKVAQRQKEQQQQHQAALLQSLSALTSSSLPFALGSGSPGGAAQVPLLNTTIRDTLSRLDLVKTRQTILRTFTQEAFYLLCDVWREGSLVVGDAIRAYHAHIAGRERRPDWRGFFVSVFGVEKMTSLLKPEKSEKPTPAASEIEEGSKDEGKEGGADKPVAEVKEPAGEKEEEAEKVKEQEVQPEPEKTKKS
ncbi:hypothetical protein BSKO_01801 [Bryopsis sp. KO-2023]|nr:hypothetical protein BSKO_01801 [Bryopsis sp. KO-2023]